MHQVGGEKQAQLGQRRRGVFLKDEIIFSKISFSPASLVWQRAGGVIVRTGGRSKFEWSECQENISRSTKAFAARSSYKPAPHVFLLYASATLHTKLDQRMPTIMKIFLFAIIVFVIVMVMFVGHFRSRYAETQKASQPFVASANKNSPVNNGNIVSVSRQAAACAGFIITDSCKCFDEWGKQLQVDEKACRIQSAAFHPKQHKSTEPAFFDSRQNQDSQVKVSQR
jgi:hypothetical protein